MFWETLTGPTRARAAAVAAQCDTSWSVKAVAVDALLVCSLIPRLLCFGLSLSADDGSWKSKIHEPALEVCRGLLAGALPELNHFAALEAGLDESWTVSGAPSAMAAATAHPTPHDLLMCFFFCVCRTRSKKRSASG